MGKKILAVVAGVFAGALCTGLGEFISHQLYPPPAGLDFNDTEAVRAFVATLPSSAFVILLLIWTVSSFVGGLVAALISKDFWKRATLITGAILLVFAVINMAMVPHPIWLNVAAVIVYIPAAYYGGRLIKRT